MPNPAPLNPDGLRAAEELMIRTDRITKINYLDAERIITAYLAVAQQDAVTDVARMRDMVAEAIDNPGESVHEFVSLPDLYQLLDHLAVAQPVVNSVEKFINQRPEYITALKNTRGTDDQADYHRWQGGAEARRQLAEALGWTVPHNPGETTRPAVKP